MSKYCNGLFFTSPYANISPPATSFDMARSSSQNSTASMTLAPSAYVSLATSHPLSRCSSITSNSTTSHPSSAPAPTSAPAMRRTSSSSSSSGWLASPYRSCLTTSYETNPTSYLSDDDLLSLAIPVEIIPNPSSPVKQQQQREMTTEEQIQHLRDIQEQEERDERLRREALAMATARRTKQVRFESAESAAKKPRRPSQLKRRSTAVRKGLSGLNGPM